ncbi:hypothetical protein JCM5296_004951 [Sporobolomyces johnsonii]
MTSTVRAGGALAERSFIDDSGRNVQDWISSRSPTVVFVLTVILFFVLALVCLAVFWETLRKCRTSLRTSAEQERARQAQWLRMPDGSSVLASAENATGRGGPRAGEYLGPMNSLIRDARQGGGGGDGYGYQPTRTGTSRAMVGAAQLTGGLYVPYDPPPVQRSTPAGEGGQRGREARARPESSGGTSGWSESTRVADVSVQEGKKEPLILPPQPYPPHSPQPIPSVAPSLRPTHSSAPSISASLNTTRTSFPLPGSPRTSALAATSASDREPTPIKLDSGAGEARFSTPKAPSGSAVTHKPLTLSNTTNSVRPTVGVTSTSGWSLPTLLGAGPSTTPSQPPKVELNRSWSIGTWIPGLSKRDVDEEEATMKLMDKADRGEE